MTKFQLILNLVFYYVMLIQSIHTINEKVIIIGCVYIQIL